MVELSIIIATKDRPERLKKCLDKVSVQTKKPHEIVIIDGSSKPFAGIKTLSKKMKIVYKNKKSSMVEARNIGIGHAAGNIILFLDDDSFIEKHYIENILKFYDTHPEAGGAEGNIVNEKGSKILARLLNFPRFPRRNDVMCLRSLHGCNMSFRKEVFKDFMFDENLIGYYNDDDEFCGRVSKKYKLFFVPSARLIHYQTQYGGARIDHYTNYNTLVFNQFYTLWKLPDKNVFDVLGYMFSQAVMIMRAFIFVREGRHMAIKGILRGYRRVVSAIIDGNVQDRIRSL
ncbi:MAG: glycosyltransferase [Candidatus Aenigmarchaeota archaeon]|nr:glycosyltransferase [Candidatus Aenigmarchaeota archaeon]